MLKALRYYTNIGSEGIVRANATTQFDSHSAKPVLLHSSECFVPSRVVSQESEDLRFSEKSKAGNLWGSCAGTRR